MTFDFEYLIYTFRQFHAILDQFHNKKFHIYENMNFLDLIFSIGFTIKHIYPTIIALTTVLHGPVSPLRFTQRNQYHAILPVLVASNFTTKGDAEHVP
jgi:hypothetical protein